MQNYHNHKNRRKYDLKIYIVKKKHIFWLDRYFICSIGEVSSATAKKYITEQG